MTLRRRILWLLACVAAGAVVGAVGEHLTGNPAWYAAVTVAVALGWLAIADPGACESQRRTSTDRPAPPQAR